MYDYHTHSSFSDDSTEKLNDMIEEAEKLGVKQIAVTDHYDPDYPNPDWPFLIDFDKYYPALLSAEEMYKGRIDVIKGIEIGIQHGDTMKKCVNQANSFCYDFIIGSFHCFDGMDMEIVDYDEIKPEEAVRRYYEYMLKCLTEYKDYDILGHFNIIDRYIPYLPDYSEYTDLIAEVLKVIISDDKGIELNTSSFRYKMGQRTTASREILLLYKDLCRGKTGREPFVTFGSDAHFKEHIAYRYDDALAYLKSLGIDKLATYKNRERKLISI